MLSSITRKSIAVFFLVLIIQSVVVPTVSYALTAGPTAPEATSFEPVDTTNMVDLATGDFTYNIPLIEIPGPAGNYPLSLSYHAGIQPDQEASWTGLGFTLNPGSISRMVNGYPDDHNGVTNVDRNFWEGGQSESYTLGVSVGVANGVNVTGGLTYAQDTYRGSGIGGYVGGNVSRSISNAVGIGMSLQVGISPYGDFEYSGGANVGVGRSAGLANSSASIGLNFNSEGRLNASLSGGVGVGNKPLIGASISTAGGGPGFSVAGMTRGVHNSRAGNISTRGDNFDVDIPVFYVLSIRLGRSYTRYWTDETANIHTFGSLYFNNVSPNFQSAFDTYDLLDTSLDMVDHDNAEKVLGGSFPDTDLYTVTAQGLGGTIRPYHFQQHLYRQDKLDKNGKVFSKSYKLGTVPIDKPVEFRFTNDFSNRFEYNPTDIDVTSSALSFDFNGDVFTGEEGDDGYVRNHLAGSRHVEWYTNHEIMGATETDPKREGFIDCVAEGFVRNSDQQIGGFSITNTSGVTYHYALPAYSYDERMKSENVYSKKVENGEAYNTLSKPEKYAYTWFLTAVTGPDFIDRNNNGLVDDGDWGYWVNFEYKKWFSDYKWRNPGEGGNKDLDGEFQFYAAGKKEIYHLQKVRTQSHVAVFETSQRYDGREVLDLDRGGFGPIPIGDPTCLQKCPAECENQICSQGNCPEPAYTDCIVSCETRCANEVIAYNFTRPARKLDRIKLFNAKDFVSGHTSDDFVLRVIAFDYDYMLAPGTPNSFNEACINEKPGKLTLESLQFFGKKNVGMIPPMRFDYKNATYKKDYVDAWGYFKNDFDPAFRENQNEIMARATTAQSALDVDAWSLNKITTSLGAQIRIEYESDRYDDVALAQQQTFRTKYVTDHGQNKLKVTFWEQDVNLDEHFKVGDEVGIDLVGCYYLYRNTSKDCDCLPTNSDRPVIQSFDGSASVAEVHTAEGYIVVSGESYYRQFTDEKVIKRSFRPTLPCRSGIAGPPVECKFTFSGANAWPHVIPIGVVFAAEKPKYGGGIRVKSVGLHNDDSVVGRVTLYEYEQGTTTYEPFEILAPKVIPEFDNTPKDDVAKVKNMFKRSVYKKLYRQIGISRQIPGPGVMYKYVTVSETNVTSDKKTHMLPNYSKYEFEVFQEGMADVINHGVHAEPGVSDYYEGVAFEKAYHNKVSVKDYTARIGNLKTVTLFNTANNEVVSQTINHYLHDALDGSFDDNVTEYEQRLAAQFSNQGVLEQAFTRARIIHYKQSDPVPYPALNQFPFFKQEQRSLMATISKLETFPSVATGQTSINYKTGMKTETTTLGFDFYSGEATKTLTTDSYGNRYLTTTVPAYRRYGEMNSKVYNKANKNMLSQTAEQYSFLVNEQNEPEGLLSASIQTWSNDMPVLGLSASEKNVWRQQSQYVWDGQQALNADGSYKYEEFAASPFQWNNPATSINWLKAGELTLYDKYSHALEATDVNGHYAATRMNESQQKVIGSAANAAYGEMACAGAEYYAGNADKEGGVSRGGGNPSTAHAHTGQYSLVVGNGSSGFNYTLRKSEKADMTKKYRASVWVYLPGEAETQADLDKLELYYSINGEEKTMHPTRQKNKSKSWYLLNIDIPPTTADEIYISVRNGTQRGAYFDDFRIHPLDASLVTYVYDLLSGEMVFMLDANNIYTKFEYDAMGRLIRTSREMLNFDFGEGKESFRIDAVQNEIKYNYGKKN